MEYGISIRPCVPLMCIRLEVGELRAAGESRAPGRKIQNRGGEDVGLRVRIAFDGTENAGRLLAEKKSRQRDRIAADIEQRASAGLINVPDVRGIAVEIAEEAGNQPQLSDAAGTHQFARADPARMGPHHERFADFHARAIAHGQKLAASAAVVLIGFSQSTCLPASAALIDHGTCK